MIKINLDSTLKGKNKITVRGEIEVRGKVVIVAQEIQATLNDFKETCPEALELALAMLVNEMDDQEEE